MARPCVERAPEAGSSVEAAVALGEAVGAAVTSGPPDMPPALAPASAEAVAILAVEPPVAADAEMAEASLLDASEEGGAEPRSVLGSGNLVPARRSPDGRRQLLRFRTRGASDPLFVIDDEREEQSWDGLCECAEATVGSLRSTLEVLCRDVPKILQVMISTGGVSRSGSGPVGLRIPSSFWTTSERSSLGTGFVSVPRRRWGRFGQPWRSFAGTFPRSSR